MRRFWEGLGNPPFLCKFSRALATHCCLHQIPDRDIAHLRPVHNRSDAGRVHATNLKHRNSALCWAAHRRGHSQPLFVLPKANENRSSLDSRCYMVSAAVDTQPLGFTQLTKTTYVVVHTSAVNTSETAAMNQSQQPF